MALQGYEGKGAYDRADDIFILILGETNKHSLPSTLFIWRGGGQRAAIQDEDQLLFCRPA